MQYHGIFFTFSLDHLGSLLPIDHCVLSDFTSHLLQNGYMGNLDFQLMFDHRRANLSCFVTRVLALSTRVPALACSALTPMHFSQCAS